MMFVNKDVVFFAQLAPIYEIVLWWFILGGSIIDNKGM